MHAGRPIVSLRDGFHEVCVSCIRLGERGIPWGGGGYFRLIPYPLWTHGVRMILRSGMPYIFYIHPWEIDPGQPRVAGMKATNSFRQRVNLHRCEERFAALVGAFEWMPVCDLVDKWNVDHGQPGVSCVPAHESVEQWPPCDEAEPESSGGWADVDRKSRAPAL